MTSIATVCIECQGVDCDLETRCIECTDISDVAMSDYVNHKLSLKKKILSKCKLKAPLPPSAVIADRAVVAVDPPPAKLASPVLENPVSENLSGVESALGSEVQLMFASFAKSLEGGSSSIDECFSQVMSSSSSKVIDSRDNVSCQDVFSRSFAAPSRVAVRSVLPGWSWSKHILPFSYTLGPTKP